MEEDASTHSTDRDSISFEHFTGREEVLSAIISKLDQPRKYPRVSIVGLGGIG